MENEKEWAEAEMMFKTLAKKGDEFTQEIILFEQNLDKHGIKLNFKMKEDNAIEFGLRREGDHCILYAVNDEGKTFELKKAPLVLRLEVRKQFTCFKSCLFKSIKKVYEEVTNEAIPNT